MHKLCPSARIRTSPYYSATLADGLNEISIYNSMVMPVNYGDPEAEFWRLINGVSMWDVAVQRQVQLKGPDAKRLAQILSPRDLSKLQLGQGKYVPLCNHDGILINDPVLLKIDDNLIWLSIADSDIWFWAKAIAAERKLKVEICEPDVSPLAIQGPKAEDVIASIFGDWIRELKYFWFKEIEIEGIPVVVQRSGWSKQGGFEIYLRDGRKGEKLWNLVKEAGKRWDIGPGAPTTPERYESGLISCRGDTDDSTNPFEVRLGKYVDLEVPDDVIGIQALRKINAEGPNRHQLGLKLDGDKPSSLGFSWGEIRYADQAVGSMTCCIWSYRLKQNIGYALIRKEVSAGESVQVMLDSGPVNGILVELPFF